VSPVFRASIRQVSAARDAAAKVDLSEIKAAARFPGNPGLDPEGA
jgi:hypothetical protein